MHEVLAVEVAADVHAVPAVAQVEREALGDHPGTRGHQGPGGDAEVLHVLAQAAVPEHALGLEGQVDALGLDGGDLAPQVVDLQQVEDGRSAHLQVVQQAVVHVHQAHPHPLVPHGVGREAALVGRVDGGLAPGLAALLALEVTPLEGLGRGHGAGGQGEQGGEGEGGEHASSWTMPTTPLWDPRPGGNGKGSCPVSFPGWSGWPGAAHGTAHPG